MLLTGLGADDGGRAGQRPRSTAWHLCASRCSSVAPRRPAPTPPAVAWWSAGSRRSGAGWRWASGRWPSRSASASPRSRSPWSPTATACTPRCGCRRSPPPSPPRRGRARRRRPAAPDRAATARRANPYRGDRFLARIHGVSVLLVVPQFVVWTFALVWLVQDRGWTPAAAGALVAGAQVGGALGRIAAGQLSDLVGSPDAPAALGRGRRRPDDGAARARGRARLGRRRPAGRRWPPCSPSPTTASPSPPSPSAPARTGRVAPSACRTPRSSSPARSCPPLGGLAVTHTGYAATFALAAVFPLLAVALVPVRDEHGWD